MSGNLWIIAPITLLGAVGVCALTLLLRSHLGRRRFAKAALDFRRQREYLEAKFFEIASQSGKPRGLRWSDCDFEDDVTYARDRQSGRLTAIVGVAIRFEAIEGGDMEDVPAVGNVRIGSAVFYRNDRRWQTSGRAVLNLNPQETIDYYGESLELVVQEPTTKSEG